VSQQHFGPHPSSPVSAASPAAPALARETEAVRQLIACGDYRGALDRAKEIHKSSRTPASEALLVDAYMERIRALMGRGLVVEAKALVDLVRQRYPSSRKRVDELLKPSGAGAASLEELIRPLADFDLATADQRPVTNGMLESSGVSPTGAMMELVEASRVYEANVRMIQNQDNVMGSLIGRILQR
jgi:hypothetical protein